MGEVVAGPLFGEEGIMTAELDLSEITRAKMDFDVIGHYARPDIFKFEIPNQPDTLNCQ
jgi:nitrilase